MKVGKVSFVPAVCDLGVPSLCGGLVFCGKCCVLVPRKGVAQVKEGLSSDISPRHIRVLRSRLLVSQRNTTLLSLNPRSKKGMLISPRHLR